MKQKVFWDKRQYTNDTRSPHNVLTGSKSLMHRRNEYVILLFRLPESRKFTIKPNPTQPQTKSRTLKLSIFKQIRAVRVWVVRGNISETFRNRRPKFGIIIKNDFLKNMYAYIGPLLEPTRYQVAIINRYFPASNNWPLEDPTEPMIKGPRRPRIVFVMKIVSSKAGYISCTAQDTWIINKKKESGLRLDLLCFVLSWHSCLLSLFLVFVGRKWSLFLPWDWKLQSY